MTRRVGLLPRFRAARVLVAVAMLPACQFCDDTEQFLPQGTIEPSVLDLGPITTGTTCPAVLTVSNLAGQADLEVTANSATLPAQDGEFTIIKVPAFVRIGASEELVINYTAGSEVGAREGTSVEIVTNDRDNDGKLGAAIVAFVADSPVALARAECDVVDTGGADPDEDGDGVASPCGNLNFGAVLISEPTVPVDSRPGRNISLRVINDGNADLEVQGAVLGGPGASEFQVVGARRGSQVFPFPVTVPAGRSGDCGELSGADNELLIDVRYAPITLGAAVADLSVLTTGREGALIEVALTGQGAETGILTNPNIVRFGDVAEGTTATETVLVQNIGTAEASVTESCIDLEDDGTCDGLCTAAAADVTLDGTLSCEVKDSAGAHVGKGFVLGPTDAAADGDDERTVEIHWTPSAAQPAIPVSAVLLLKSNIQNSAVFKVGIVGGNAGILDVSSPSPCGSSQCLQAVGAADDVKTWTGSLTLTLQNAGDATLTIQGIDFEAGTGPTIADDWTIGAPGSTTLAAGASTTVELTYANLDCSSDPCRPIDNSGDDGVNLIVDHNGVLGSTLVPIGVLAPQ